MFLSARQCAEQMTQLPRLKITVQGIYPWISCPLHISWNPFSFNFLQIFLSVRRCGEHMTMLPRLKVKVILFTFEFISWTLLENFIKLHSNVPLNETMCITYDSATQTQGHCHTSRSCDLPFELCPLHISRALWTIFIKLFPNLPLSELVHRTNELATQTQGHTSRSWELILNFLSAPYLLNHLLDFH